MRRCSDEPEATVHSGGARYATGALLWYIEPEQGPATKGQRRHMPIMMRRHDAAWPTGSLGT